MTDLLIRRRPSGSSTTHSRETGAGSPSAGRPLALNAALAALTAAGIGLLGCWVVALIGWFASDGGAHGETTAALKVGSGAWLLAHGADLDLGNAVITAIPLGLTLWCAWLVFRAARWAGQSSQVEDLASLGLASVVLGGTYGSLALATAVLSATSRAELDLPGAFLGATLLATVAGACGLVAGSDLRGEIRALLPGHARAVLFGGAVGVVSLWAAGAVLVAAAVAMRGGAVANVLARLHVDAGGAFFSLLLVVVIAPNLATWGSSYLLGGGFQLGTGSVVAPSGVVLGPVPAVPVLAAVPDSGGSPAWYLSVLAVPVLCGLLIGWAVNRRFPTVGYSVAAGRAAAAAVVAALGAGVLAWLSGGAVGAGRMRDIGPDVTDVLLMALLSLGAGAVAAALIGLWWAQRHGTAHETTDAELGLQRRMPWRDSTAGSRRSQQRRTRLVSLLAQRRASRGSARPETGASMPSWARLGVWGAAPTPPERDPGEPDDQHTTTIRS